MARVISVTKEDFNAIKSKYTNYSRTKKRRSITGHEVTRDAIKIALEREGNFKDITVKYQRRYHKMPKQYVVCLSRIPLTYPPKYEFEVEIDVTWHMSRHYPFQFTVPGIPARITKHG